MNMKTAYSRIPTMASALAFLFIWEAPVLSAELPEYLKQQKEIRIGVKCDYPPSGFLDKDGKMAGIEIEMARELGKRAFGSPDMAKLQCVTSQDRIPALTSKKIDAIIATLGIYPARQEIIDFSKPYSWGASNIIYPGSEDYKSINDFKGKAVTLLKGASQGAWLEKNQPDIKNLRLNSVGDSLSAVRQGRAQGYTGDTSVLYSILSANKDFKMLPDENQYDVGVIGIGIRKGETELKAYLDQFIDELRSEKFFTKVIGDVISDPYVRDQSIKFYESDPPKKS